jgi:Peptidase S46
MRLRQLLILAVLAPGGLIVSAPAFSDAGMWTFDNFPSAAVKREYGVNIDSAWLARVRSATIRLSICTASFVSPDGLILTNHHCAEACLDQHSTAQSNLVRDGFLAATREQELRCGTQIADVLMETENVTAKVNAALAGLEPKAANEVRKKTLTQLEQECEERSRHAPSGPLKCESVTLYEGGQYWLYEYHRYADVRLVFSPEDAIAAFGGDPDNFQFPRWCFDMSLLRAYGPDGKPASTPSFLTFRPAGPDAGEAVFVAGHPRHTDRLLTVAELLELRDVFLPHWLLRAAELRGRYIQFAKSGAEAGRIVEDPLNTLENAIKVRRMQLEALLDDRLMTARRADEAALRAKVAADAQLAASTGDPWNEIATAEQHARELYLPYTFLEQGAGFTSQLFN